MSDNQPTLFDDQFKLKRCSKCKEDKPRDQFSKKKTAPDGLRYSCKECDKKAKTEYRSNPVNNEKEKLSAQKWYGDNREKALDYHAKRRARNPELFKARDKASKEKNREKAKESTAKWRANNKDRKRTGNAAWYSKNRDRELKRMAAYRAAHPEVISAGHAKRRAAELNAPIGDIAEIAKWEKTWRLKDAVHCYWCDKEFAGAECHADHYVPLAKDGPHHVTNLVISCAPCNLRKNKMMPEDFERLLAEERNS